MGAAPAGGRGARRSEVHSRQIPLEEMPEPAGIIVNRSLVVLAGRHLFIGIARNKAHTGYPVIVKPSRARWEVRAAVDRADRLRGRRLVRVNCEDRGRRALCAVNHADATPIWHTGPSACGYSRRCPRVHDPRPGRACTQSVQGEDLEAALSFYAPHAVWDASPWGMGVFEGQAPCEASFFEDGAAPYSGIERQLRRFVIWATKSRSP